MDKIGTLMKIILFVLDLLTNLSAHNLSQREGILDVKAVDAKGRNYDIEIQVLFQSIRKMVIFLIKEIKNPEDPMIKEITSNTPELKRAEQAMKATGIDPQQIEKLTGLTLNETETL